MSLRGAELRRHAEPAQAGGGCAADPRRGGGEVGAEAPPLEHQVPADLPLVEVQPAAAGDAPPDLDAVRPAVVEPHLVRQHLVHAHERARPEALEADRLRDPPRIARLDQRPAEGGVLAPAAQAGVDDPDVHAANLAEVDLPQRGAARGA
jgi:hypothetical protein